MTSYYLAFEKVPEPSIQKKLKKLGATRIKGSFWIMPKGKVKVASRLAENAVIFKRCRRRLVPRVVEDEGLYELGSLSILVYKIPQNKSQVRKKISSFLRVSPAFKIARGVYAFPQVKHQRSRCKIMGPNDLVMQLEEGGLDIHLFVNLVLIHPSEYSKNLIKQMEERIAFECESIITASKMILKAMKNRESRGHIDKRISDLKARTKALAKLSLSLREIFKLRLESRVSKANKAMSACRCTYRKFIEGR